MAEPGRVGAVVRRLPKLGGRVPVWSSRLVFLLGLANLASAVFPRRRALLDFPIDLGPAVGMAVGSVLGIAVGFGLLIMARGLRHRKRAAWRAVVGWLAVGIIVHLAKGIDPVQTLISVAVTVVLLASRNQFVGRGDPRDRRAVPAVLLAMTLTCWLLGSLITQADRDGLVPGWTWPDLIVHAGLGMIGVTGPVRFLNPAVATHNSVMLLGLGLITVATTLLALLSSSMTAEPATAEDRRRVRSMLTSHGQADSLGYFATRDDKSVIFSPSGKSAVAYRVVAGVCLASGDPLGDVEAWPAAIESWLRLAHERAWIPAVLAASETGARAYQRVGLDALEIGDEAVVDVARFTLDGRQMRPIRQAVNRARRAGYHTRVTRVSELSAERLEALRRTSAGWRPSRGPDRGFSMALSRFGAAEDADAVIVEGYSDDRQLVAVLQLVPWGARGWSLDIMRRRAGLYNGMMELMVADVVQSARERGIGQISLNFALFRSSLERGERIGAGPVARAWVRLLLFASRWWQIASLYRANAKFCPRWEPRFLCFANVRDLGDIVIASARVEGFLSLPRFRELSWLHRADRSRAGGVRCP